ncbi:unnamed protein product [Hermetia illucens]|uniref:Uncharacterized protein n=1 Tax=Hermetia illucens TaxID=343691 RepID=A0A7R8YQB6_HERIL|nr:unnamed protein product [Hermetia illucens]
MLDNLNLGSHSSLNEDVAFKKAAPFSELLQRNSKNSPSEVDCKECEQPLSIALNKQKDKVLALDSKGSSQRSGHTTANLQHKQITLYIYLWLSSCMSIANIIKLAYRS